MVALFVIRRAAASDGGCTVAGERDYGGRLTTGYLF